MNLRNMPKPSESLEDLEMLLAYHKLVLEDAYTMRDRSLETIKELKVKITCKHHKLKVGMIVYAFSCNEDRLHYLDGKIIIPPKAEVITIVPNDNLEHKPNLIVSYLEGEKAQYGYNNYQVYSYWEFIKD